MTEYVVVLKNLLAFQCCNVTMAMFLKIYYYYYC